MSIVPEFTTALLQTKVERFCQLSNAVAVLYEHAITFDYEVEYFWNTHWSLGKVLFLWSRYYGMAFNIGNAAVFMLQHPSVDSCLRFFRYQQTGVILQILTTHFILQLRLYAMYDRSKKLLIFFVFLMLAEISVAIYLFETPYPGLIAGNEPVPGVFICADADPAGKHFIAYLPTMTIIVEWIFVILALFRAFRNYRRAKGGILTVLMRDSVRYFVVIFMVDLACAISWFINDITLNESLTGYFSGIVFILANRMMTNIRGLYYGGETTQLGSTKIRATTTYGGSARKKAFDAIDTGLYGADAIELKTFSERQGF